MSSRQSEYTTLSAHRRSRKADIEDERRRRIQDRIQANLDRRVTDIARQHRDRRLARERVA